MRVRGRWVAVLASISLAGAIAVPTAGAQDDFPPVDQPGVTDTEIKVGGVATVTNDPTGNTLGSSFDGAKAYFDYINSTGGIYGRELVLESEHDDQLANNRSEVQALLDEDIFAVLPVAVDLFAGADLLAESGIPTFGWNINPEWGSEDNTPGPPNLFGDKGSFICFTCAQPSAQVWLARALGAERVGLVAYNVPQSQGCAEGVENSLEEFPIADVVFSDKSLAFGAIDYSAQVAQMAGEDVDYVITCIDANGGATLAREMKKQGLEAPLLLANAYNHGFAKENAEILEGSYVMTTFAPFETKPKPPGLKRYEKWIKKAGGDKNENSLVGWMNADLFVTGLKAAGSEFTQQEVVDAINAIGAYDAGGLVADIDWTTAHENGPDCYAILKFVDGKLKPSFGKPGKPFACFSEDLETIPKQPDIRG